jgi:hypothetical protein
VLETTDPADKYAMVIHATAPRFAEIVSHPERQRF